MGCARRGSSGGVLRVPASSRPFSMRPRRVCEMLLRQGLEVNASLSERTQFMMVLPPNSMPRTISADPIPHYGSLCAGEQHRSPSSSVSRQTQVSLESLVVHSCRLRSRYLCQVVCAFPSACCRGCKAPRRGQRLCARRRPDIFSLLFAWGSHGDA